MVEEVEVAGLWCSDVLALLSEYLDKELPASKTAQIEAHLAECDRCLRFGTRFSTIIRELVSKLNVPEPLDSNLAERLRERVKAASSKRGQTEAN